MFNLVFAFCFVLVDICFKLFELFVLSYNTFFFFNIWMNMYNLELILGFWSHFSLNFCFLLAGIWFIPILFGLDFDIIFCKYMGFRIYLRISIRYYHYLLFCKYMRFRIDLGISLRFCDLEISLGACGLVFDESIDLIFSLFFSFDFHFPRLVLLSHDDL